MNDIPESEARGLLSSPCECVNIGDWSVSKVNPYAFTLECGLLRDGVFTQLHVQLIYAYRPDVKSTHMKFSVFRKTPQGLERVFQLDINTNPRSLKNAHHLPHIHWGKPRTKENKDWLSYDFNKALSLFMSETKINFDPLPELPGFKLK